MILRIDRKHAAFFVRKYRFQQIFLFLLIWISLHNMIPKIKLKEIYVFFVIYSNRTQNTKLLQKLEESLKKLHDEAADSANTKLPSLILPTNGLEVSQHESLVPAIGEEVRNRNRHSFVSYNRSSEPNTATTIDLSEDEQINYYDDEEE